MRKAIMLCLLLTFMGCKIKPVFQNCRKVYDSYISLRMKGDKKNALINLNKAIDCDKENPRYIDEKINYLISLEEFSEAVKQLEILEKTNENYFKYYPLNGILNIRLGETKKGDTTLKRVYNNLKSNNFNKDNYNIFIYKVLLDAYFQNKDYAIEQILKTVKDNNFEKHHLDVIDHLHNLLKSNKSSNEVLYDFFQISIPHRYR
ncbi:tetratricopeptide repeat protein [Aquimarina litoralis]|uniref:tetratricopeptide repeat protein n=1 Tax=Aquimarina litoralis TaxID=584605 RepID=UPI001C5772AC|nr:hypothetical protein [Aquimarina litoralis]MBW1298504.1 hypothetical protein [Aquimarina litoralis]